MLIQTKLMEPDMRCTQCTLTKLYKQIPIFDITRNEQ